MPSILVQAPDSQPVAIVTEFDPSPAVEDNAKAWLGRTPGSSVLPIEQSIAVRIPAALRQDHADMVGSIAAADFGYCVFSDDPAAPERWPGSGWLEGGIDHIAKCIEHSMVPQRLIDESVSIFCEAVHLAVLIVTGDGDFSFGDAERDIGLVLS